MHDWICFSSPDMVNWTEHPVPLRVKDFAWAKADAWAVLIDDNGQAYLFWGNTILHYVRLKENMIEMDGPIKTIPLPHFTEAPWIHKHGDWYYLSYAYEFPEKTAYAMSRSIEGPWEYKGILNELTGNYNTNHQAIIDFKDKSYFIYHNGALVPDAGSFHRSVRIDYLYYNPDGTMKRVIMTSEGVK
ncbi:MAG TPA: family 43 glycosylhydrolase [Puia sp.]|nr:family 43 glycosylhydrolase [Puia sp.]